MIHIEFAQPALNHSLVGLFRFFAAHNRSDRIDRIDRFLPIAARCSKGQRAFRYRHGFVGISKMATDTSLASHLHWPPDAGIVTAEHHTQASPDCFRHIVGNPEPD